MNNIFINEIELRLMKSASQTNFYADEKDLSRNKANYGATTAYADTLIMLGFCVSVTAYSDGDYVRILKVTTNTGTTQFEFD